MQRPAEHFSIEHTPDHVHVAFPEPCPVLSSAVLNGGTVNASHILNLRVPKNLGGAMEDFEPSSVTLETYCRGMGWEGRAVGMMTAAKMTSFRKESRKARGVSVTALVTAGISNAGRAGDPAEFEEMDAGNRTAGTINIIVLTNAVFTPAAMVEAVLTATEAKTAALQDLGVRSVKTGRQATGTGTDAIAVGCGFGPVSIRYCGKHTLFGEMLATAVIAAVTSSVESS